MTHLEVKSFIKQTLIPHVDYEIVSADPAIGIIYVINNFISGHVRLLGKGGGQYPHKYLDMIDSVFGFEKNTVEVCSGKMYGMSYSSVSPYPFTIDINPEFHPDMVEDGQTLHKVMGESFNRWRCDPPYNEKTAKEMYNCEMPSLIKLLKAGARVVKPGSLLFLLCAQNYQHCPSTLKRIGLITITVVPNNEIRALNIYLKL